jgi:uncharacterized membrane protein
MKTRILRTLLAVAVGVGLALSASVALAQVNASVPQLSYGVPQIIQLAQAKVGDDTIIAYVKNSGNNYGLTADQIIYLRQQGVSDAVITTMLNQPKPAIAAATVAAPAGSSTVETTPLYSPRQSEQNPAASAGTSTAETSTATVAPTVTYVQTVPASPYYYYQPYYYPSYAWYPPVSFSFGWGGGWRGGWHR